MRNTFTQNAIWFSSTDRRTRDKVWKGSVRGEAPRRLLSRAQKVRIMRHARRLEARSRGSSQGAIVVNGKVSRVGLQVLQALLFDFHNLKDGRCDPCYATIAAAAAVSISSVYRSLRRLNDCGILAWVKRCTGSMQGGRYQLEQDSNAYCIRPAEEWSTETQQRSVEPWQWGASPPSPGALERARDAQNAQAIQKCLELEPDDALAAALAALGRARLAH